MFKHAYQTGCMSILYSLRDNCLQAWRKKAITGGHIKRLRDEEIESCVLEILGPGNVRMTAISCPRDPGETLAMKLPYLVMIIKDLKLYFMFEVEIIDDKRLHRRFLVSNFQAATRIGPSVCLMPLILDQGWNEINFDLPGCTKQAYGTTYMETVRVKIHANCRVRSVFFSDKIYSEDVLQPEFKLFLPIQRSMRHLV